MKVKQDRFDAWFYEVCGSVCFISLPLSDETKAQEEIHKLLCGQQGMVIMRRVTHRAGVEHTGEPVMFQVGK